MPVIILSLVCGWRGKKGEDAGRGGPRPRFNSFNLFVAERGGGEGGEQKKEKGINLSLLRRGVRNRKKRTCGITALGRQRQITGGSRNSA